MLKKTWRTHALDYRFGAGFLILFTKTKKYREPILGLSYLKKKVVKKPGHAHRFHAFPIFSWSGTFKKKFGLEQLCFFDLWLQFCKEQARQRLIPLPMLEFCSIHQSFCPTNKSRMILPYFLLEGDGIGFCHVPLLSYPPATYTF